MLPDVLRGYAAATLEAAEDAGTLEAVRGDLEGFSRALVTFDDLRRVLIDPTISELTRRTVIAELLTGRATDEAARLIAFAARVAPPAELPVVMNDLAGLVGTPGEAGNTPAGEVRASRARLRGFAERVLEMLPGTSDVDVVEDELFGLSRLVDSARALREALTNELVPIESRVALLGELLSGRAQAATLRLVSYVLRAGHVRNIAATLAWLAGLCAEERGRRIAEVHSAVELEEDERRRLAEALRVLTGRDVEIRVIEDPTVVGGVLVSVGDLIIDGTVRLRVERLRDALAAPA